MIGVGFLTFMTTVVSSVASTEVMAADVVAVVGLLVLAVAHPVERVGDVLGGQRLAVRPLQPGAQVVGPGQPVVGGLPALGQRRLGAEVACP